MKFFCSIEIINYARLTPKILYNFAKDDIYTDIYRVIYIDSDNIYIDILLVMIREAFCRDIPSNEKNPDPGDFAKIRGTKIPQLRKIPNPGD